MSVLLDVEHHDNLVGYKKLAYVAALLEFEIEHVAIIIRENTSLVEKILDDDFPKDIFEEPPVYKDLYILLMLFTRLLDLRRYNLDETKRLLADESDFENCIEKPPWYLAGYPLRDYLLKEGMKAVYSSLNWFGTH